MRVLMLTLFRGKKITVKVNFKVKNYICLYVDSNLLYSYNKKTKKNLYRILLLVFILLK